MSELFTPPKYFKDVVFHRHTDRSIGWLELFYDLVYIATLIQLGNFLSDNVSILGFGQFLVMLTVLWWAWTGETFYQNLYVSDDLIHRILVFLQIFAVAVMGLSVSEAFGELYVQFTLGYVVTRLLTVVMFWRASRHHEASSAFTRGYIAGFIAGIAIWLGSLLLPVEYHWVGWLIGIAVELSIPLLPAIRRHTINWAPDFHHISERFGIFTIIVLGESFVKILEDSQGTVFGIEQGIFSTAGFIVLYSLWWLYFSDTANKIIDFNNSLKSTAWSYAHLPLAASLVAFGVGAKKLYAETLDHPGEALTPKYRLLYTAAIVIYLISLAVIDFGLDDEKTPENQIIEALIHIVSAVIVLVIGLTMVGLSATQFVWAIAIVMLLQVIYSAYQISQIPDEDISHQAE